MAGFCQIIGLKIDTDATAPLYSRWNLHRHGIAKGPGSQFLSTVNQPISHPGINPQGPIRFPTPQDPLKALRCNPSKSKSRLTDLNRWPSLYNDSCFEIYCVASDLGCVVDFLINRLINLLVNPGCLI